jgi:eukaryotic-like serine/threonine-protein kinase
MKPAEMLAGLTLEGGWTVLARLESGPDSTGGHFSVSYKVRGKGGEAAFLKALDYSGAFSSEDPARELQRMTEAYNFERDIVASCSGMDRVVRSITDGKTKVQSDDAGGIVEYIIFELADGDIRSHMARIGDVELTWKLRCLHHIATGLKQLHAADIAHQDLKPSNVMVFDAKLSKVGDLGRATSKGRVAPHDEADCPGDCSYGAPELLYGYKDPEWTKRRLGCDAYLLGSMVCFMFTGVSATGLLMDRVAESHHWSVWGGTYEEILPYLREAFGRVLDRFRSDFTNEQLARELASIVRELCDPDPNLRGDPKNRVRGGNPFSMERYLTRFDLLARRAEIGQFRT